MTAIVHYFDGAMGAEERVASVLIHGPYGVIKERQPVEDAAGSHIGSALCFDTYAQMPPADSLRRLFERGAHPELLPRDRQTDHGERYVLHYTYSRGGTARHPGEVKHVTVACWSIDYEPQTDPKRKGLGLRRMLLRIRPSDGAYIKGERPFQDPGDPCRDHEDCRTHKQLGFHCAQSTRDELARLKEAAERCWQQMPTHEGMRALSDLGVLLGHDPLRVPVCSTASVTAGVNLDNIRYIGLEDDT